MKEKNENVLVKDVEEEKATTVDNNSSNDSTNIQEEKQKKKKKSSKKNSNVKVENNSSDAQSSETETKLEIKTDDTTSLAEVKTDSLINTKPVSKKTLIIVSVVSFCVILLLAIFSTVFALVNINNDKIIQGISIKGIDVSGLSQEQALEKITKVAEEKLSQNIDLVKDDYRTTIVPTQLESNFDFESSVKSAYSIGRSGNIIKNNYDIISSYLFKTDIIPSFSYNEDFIDNLINEIQDALPDKLINPSYSIENDKLVITKGVNGYEVNSNLLKLKVISALSDFKTNINEIEIPVQEGIAESIDLEKIYNEIHKEPQDAYFTKDPYTVHPHVDGVDFAISMEDAKKLLEEDKETYEIPLKITSPKVTTSQIGSEAFPNLLANYSTTYSTSNVNRSTNIRLASNKINGIVLMPGQTFSYNSTVGRRTPEAGFKPAAVYLGGEVTTDYGGGICQVSSTLYNSVLLSNLQIVERYNHGFNPGYVPAGRDATVSWGGPDFKFKNNRKFPIKIVCSGGGGTINVKIYGVKEDGEPEVEIQSYITSYIQYKEIQQVDNSLSAGQTKVIEKGSNGCRSVCYKILKKNGQVISKTLLSSDTYNPHNRVVAVGPASQSTTSTPSVPDPTSTPVATPTPTPTPTATPTLTPVVTPTPDVDLGE